MTESSNMKTPIRVIVVDDHELMRKGIVNTLSRSGEFTVVGQGANAPAAVELAAQLTPDLLLIDYRMPGDVTQAIKAILHDFPSIRIAVLSAFDDTDVMHEMLALGVHGYLTKGVNAKSFLEAVRSIARGESVSDPGHWGLTAGEKEVAELVALGLTNGEIAQRLSLNEATLAQTMRKIYTKMGISTRLQMAIQIRSIQ